MLRSRFQLIAAGKNVLGGNCWRRCQSHAVRRVVVIRHDLRATKAGGLSLLLPPAALWANRTNRKLLDDSGQQLHNVTDELTLLALEVRALAAYASGGEPEDLGRPNWPGKRQQLVVDRYRSVKMPQPRLI